MDRSGIIDTGWCMNRDELKEKIKLMLDKSVFKNKYEIHESYERNTHVIKFEFKGIDDHILIFMPFVTRKNIGKYEYISGQIITATFDLTFTNETIDEVLKFAIERLIKLRSPELERPSTLRSKGLDLILDSVNSEPIENFLNECLINVSVIASSHGISERYAQNFFRQALSKKILGLY
jgi:hypothetical protein